MTGKLKYSVLLSLGMFLMAFNGVVAAQNSDEEVDSAPPEEIVVPSENTPIMDTTSDSETAAAEPAPEITPVPDNNSLSNEPEVNSTAVELPPIKPIDVEGLEQVNALLKNDDESEGNEENPPLDGNDNDNGFSPYLQGLSALCILCGAIIFLGWLVRKFGGNTPLLAGQKFGKVLGRVSLSPRAAIHYVQSADRILVIGVTQNAISLISEFPVDAFVTETNLEEPEDAPLRAPDFLAELRQASNPPSPRTKPAEDDEMEVLRGDLQRLQQYLRQRSSDDE